MGVSYTNIYGEIDGRFYNSMLQMYAEVIRTDDTGKLIEEYDERIAAIVAGTVGIGWGFHDVLAELYEQIR
ncbi:hypothetical protein ACFQ88_08370 [Paenibacillus sp. NPDC056579]|uniref:hypothetical protein n=2 Tax=unclassified Paenibacillus TaxID=185978 RepID=UPI00369F81C3